MPDLLFEIGVEELPASYVDAAIDQLGELATKALVQARLAPAGALRTTGTPRRLVLHVTDLPARQPDMKVELSGPPADKAFKDGKPTQAAIGFAEKAKLPVEKLEIRKVEGKGAYVFATQHVEGKSAAQVLGEDVLPGIVKALAFPKSMTWVAGSKLRFARPLRRMVALLGQDVVSVTWNGVPSGRTTQGHPFLAGAPFNLEDASWEKYTTKLRERRVVVDRDERRAAIAKAVRGQGSRVEPPAALVATVANLVEWPEVMTGSFEPRFLEIPHAVIVSAIQTHLRAFPIFEAPGKVTNRFAFIANRPPHDVIRHGNERVVAARLSDASFFYEQDQKTPLEALAPKLKDVVFQDRLGSYDDKQKRVEAIALAIEDRLGWPGSRGLVPQATSLMKADLLTQVVGEFPELQGEIGAVYAKRQGAPDEVAAAIREAYLPRGEGDVLPETKTGTLVSLAEKLDNAACAFAANMKPTGSKDPLGVRRQVIGILRILREQKLVAPLGDLIHEAVQRLPDEILKPRKKPDPKAPPFDFGAARATLAKELLDFARDRLYAISEREGRRHDLLGAAAACGYSDVPDFWARLDALNELAKDPGFPKLVELVERTRNITKKETSIPDKIDTPAIKDPAERELIHALETARPEVQGLIEKRDYAAAGRRYLTLAPAVHTFFEKVFVMDEDPRVRGNRLCVLRDVHRLLAERFADLAEVARK